MICLIAPLAGLTQNATLITTFTNPSPAVNLFGWSVAAVGSDRMLIGAVNYFPGLPTAGAAYLFSTDGTLLTTFTNPAPAHSDGFGISMATVGNDRVLIGAGQDDTGANDAGAAYLFSTNGALLTSFTNPSPADSDFFGHSVAAVGSDRVLIGAFNDFGGSPPVGAAYLFDVNGTLLTTFTNPAPASDSGSFGISVAGLGTDRVIIGAGYDETATVSGAAYLFSTNGTLLTTFTNPSPANGDQFGFKVAALGTDRVIIGARFDDTTATNAGAAYLFSTNGTLLASFTNPTPTIGGGFGSSVAAAGNNQVLISAPANGAGAAYLFSADGTLLTSVTNPIPVNGGSFGNSVAALGNDRVFIGAPFNGVGAAYLFGIPSGGTPSLTIVIATSNSVVVSWPSPSSGFMLQQNTNGIGTANWTNVTDTVQDDGTNQILIINQPTGNRFYRLFKP